jgi:hypothetical protein
MREGASQLTPDQISSYLLSFVYGGTVSVNLNDESAIEMAAKEH